MSQDEEMGWLLGLLESLCKYGIEPPGSISYRVSMQLLSRFMDSWEIILPNVQLIKCRFHLFRSSSFSFSSQYLKELSDYQGAVFFFFLLCHLSFNGIMKKANSFQNMTDQLALLHRILFRSVLFFPLRSRNSTLVTFSDHFIFSILLHFKALQILPLQSS